MGCSLMGFCSGVDHWGGGHDARWGGIVRPVRMRASLCVARLRALMARVFGSWHGGLVSKRAWNSESFASVGHHRHSVPLPRHLFMTRGKISVVELPDRWRKNSEFEDFQRPQLYRAAADISLGGTVTLRAFVRVGSTQEWRLHRNRINGL